MAIDLEHERPISFNDAAKYLPASNRPNLSTWYRWWKYGVRGVRLETLVVGARRYTTAAAVQRFVAATTAASTPGAPAVGTAAARARDKWADEVLSAAGI